MKCFMYIFCLLSACKAYSNDSAVIFSPDKNIRLTIFLKDSVTYSVRYKSRLILHPSGIDLYLQDGGRLSKNIGVRRIKRKTVSKSLSTPLYGRSSSIRELYEEIRIDFRQPYSLEFRVYNNGLAYRILTGFKDSIIIVHEKASFYPGQDKEVLLPIVQKREGVDRFHTSFEELYQWQKIDSVSSSIIAYSPLLVRSDPVTLAITESDLEDYPGMFLTSKSAGTLEGVFAPYPVREEMTTGEFPQSVVTGRADYIAKVKGNRSFPWRIIMMAVEDRELPANDLVYLLGAPSRVNDLSWIRPGKSTEEWIIGINLFNLPFRAGINTATYKFYIDFAKRFGLERIMMDAGWSNYKDLFELHPDIDMDTISAYARANNIGLSMWTLCSTLDRQLDSALRQFKKWGVDFIMTDFMDRDDQLMVKFYHRVAAACAREKIMLMFHGAYPPKGINRTYPNVVTQEGVLGSEYNIWSNKVSPDHDLTIPFTRMLAGPMDYEPGLLENTTAAQFRSVEKKVMSQGTRCHQLAMFVVYDSPMQLFSGNPSQGLMQPDFMELLGAIPTVWDETRILEGKIGDYIITARRKGEDWYIGGMTDWTARGFEVNLDFLPGDQYGITLCEDGVNAENYPSDYRISRSVLQKAKKIWINMAPGGGFMMKLTRL